LLFIKDKFLHIGLLMVSLTGLIACGRLQPRPEVLPGLPAAEVVPTLDAGQVSAGQPLYEVHCAACHGLQGEGQPDWKVRNADGTFPAPPHDSSGHTWHHADALILEIIDQGSRMPGSPMLAFGDKLNEAEQEAILTYIKTWWGPQERAFQWQVTQQSLQP
jgi:mono/diheme cytochrome c family protein